MTRGEEELGEKWDRSVEKSKKNEIANFRCFADSLLKISGGVALGIVTSVAIFKVQTEEF